MTIMLKEKITGPSAWKGKELKRTDDWIYYLSEETMNNIESALEHVIKKGLQAPNFSKEDFPIDDNVKKEIAYFLDELENGRGFVLIRGLPIERYTDEEASIIYFGLGLHMGNPVKQSEKGDLIGHVKDVGNSERVYEQNTCLPYHTDPTDVVGLLCLRKAKKGGLSSIASIGTLYNILLETYPEYVGVLYRLFYFDHLGENEPGLSPIFSYYDGKLSCRYLRKYIESGHEKQQVPLSKVEIEAFDLIDEIFADEEVRMDMMLEPGDIQFANNYAIVHSRTDFIDYDDPKKKRHLLRLWLSIPESRKLAPEFSRRKGFNELFSSSR